jgi:hypothetical protein
MLRCRATSACRWRVRCSRLRVAGTTQAIVPLTEIRPYANRFGGSHAQRDIVHLTLVEAALRAGRLNLARALIAERTELKRTSPFNWRLAARVLEAQGRSERRSAHVRCRSARRGTADRARRFARGGLKEHPGWASFPLGNRRQPSGGVSCAARRPVYIACWSVLAAASGPGA